MLIFHLGVSYLTNDRSLRISVWRMCGTVIQQLIANPT